MPISVQNTVNPANTVLAAVQLVPTVKANGDLSCMARITFTPAYVNTQTGKFDKTSAGSGRLVAINDIYHMPTAYKLDPRQTESVDLSDLQADVDAVNALLVPLLNTINERLKAV